MRMKKYLLLLASIATMGFAATSCSDEKNDGGEDPAKGILTPWPASAMSGFARSRDRRPHMPSDTGKAPAFGGAGRGRLPMGKLRGHSPGWWKTPRAAGPSKSAASTRSEGKGPKAGQFLTQPPVFLQQLTVFGVELTVFYGKLPALGAFLIQFLQHQRALAAATS